MIKNLMLLVCVLALICGCSVVMSEKPVGDRPVVLEPAGWDGAWMTLQGEPVMMKVQDREKGVLKIAWIEDDGKMTCKSYDVRILSSGSWQFANIMDEEKKDGKSGGYLFAKIKKEKDYIVIWLPMAEKFSGLVGKKILPGRVEKESVTLGELEPQHLKIIMSGEKGLLFDWENPLFIIRAKK